MRGRPSKPSYIKLLEGNPGHRPIKPTFTPKHIDTMPEPADFLDREGRKIFKQLARDVHEMGILSKVDGLALSMLANSIVIYWRLTQELEKLGDKAYEDTQIQRIKGKFADQILVLCREFGLTPASRQRIHLPEKKVDKNDFWARLAGGGTGGRDDDEPVEQ